MRRKFYTLDVFAETPLEGNPLAVVLDCDGLDDSRMQRIAREFNLAETVFVLEPKNPINTARLRIFTPARELPFAGHPTVGATILLAELRAPGLLAAQDLRLVLEENVGDVVAYARHRPGQGARAHFELPRLPEPAGEPPDDAALAAALGLETDAIGFGDHRPCVMSAGVPFLFAPLRDRAAVARARSDLFAWGTAGPSVFLYAEGGEREGSSFHARMFASGWGIAEDPATGGAAAAFAGVLARFDPPPEGEHAFAIEQGFEMGRPSLITLGLDMREGALVGASIGGAAVIVAQARSMSEASKILDVAALDLSYAPAPWPFALREAAAIDAHWARRKAETPALFNGRVLLLTDHAFETGADGGQVLRGQFIPVDFKGFLAWREWKFPDAGVCNCFSMAALKSSDGAFLLGEMSASTAAAGSIYFAAGTPDPRDIFGDKVDLGASVIRELGEETGLTPADVIEEPGWIVVFAPPHIACMKVMRLGVTADSAKARIDAFLDADPASELTRMHIVRRVEDILERMPGFVADFLRHALAR